MHCNRKTIYKYIIILQYYIGFIKILINFDCIHLIYFKLINLHIYNIIFLMLFHFNWDLAIDSRDLFLKFKLII